MRRRYTAWLVCSGAAIAGCLSDRELDLRRSWPADHDDVADVSAGMGPTQLRPELGATVSQDDPPPPISGGTLAVIDDREAIAADPDRDLVYIVDHVEFSLRATIPLRRHDEPGRIAIDPEGRRAFVALRRGGAVVSIDLVERKVTSRIDVCPLPRGIAWDAKVSEVIVACAGGELVTVDASFVSKTTRTIGLDDLRDVVVTSKGTFVSTFRTAELVRLDASGGYSRVALPQVPNGTRRVAWRTLAAAPPPDSDEPEVVVVSQESGDTLVDRPAEYYGTGPGIGPGAVVNVGGKDFPVSAVLPVDVAVSEYEITVVSAGNSRSPYLPAVLRFARRGAAFGFDGWRPRDEPAEITSVAYTEDRRLLALSREPARLYEVSSRALAPRVDLSAISRHDTGHAIFHTSSGRGIACASCHPEGRDDGNAWRSTELGPRRTPSLLGTIASTAPYHWNGEAPDMRALVDMTFVSRMQGPPLDDDQTFALEHWLPPLAAARPADTAAVDRGKALFESERGRCATCHAGAARTNNQTVNVKTGGAFQVPSLVNVGFRAPYLHDGSVGSIAELVLEGHGDNVLTPSEAADVTTYVRTF